MRIVCFSDTHGLEDQIQIPDGDALIFCGDLCCGGRIEEYYRFAQFMRKQKHSLKIIVAGNHDWLFQREPQQAKQIFEGVTWLHDNAISIGRDTIYGTSWQPTFFNWAFNRTEQELSELYSRIFFETTVLVTHCPPYEVLDVNRDGQNCGSVALKERANNLPYLRYHLFGHIHGNWGEHFDGKCSSINCCVLTENYTVYRKPIVIDL